jgi:hypothetical protein
VTHSYGEADVKALPNLRPDATTIKVRWWSRPSRLQPTRWRALAFDRVLKRNYRMSENTVHNVLVALLTRVYVTRVGWNPPRGAKKVLFRSAARAGRQVGSPMTVADAAAHMKGNFPEPKAEVYVNALYLPLVMEQARKVVTFIKKEWIPLIFGKFYKPRVIQFRKPEFLAHMYPWYKPMEHVIYSGRYLFNSRQARTCAKGRNHHDRIKDLVEQVSRINDCHFVGLDGSAFDAHVSQEAVDMEWQWYHEVARSAGWSKEVRKLMHQQHVAQRTNKCSARVNDGKVSYTVKGNRMSGDLNTAGGNSILMELFTAIFFWVHGVPDEDWGMYVDGDDTCVFVAGRWVHLIPLLSQHFRDFNQEVKVTDVRRVSIDNMEPIEFCQCRPVKVNGHWRLVRDPWKQVNVYTRSHRWLKNTDLAKRYFSTISPPEMIINIGVPITAIFYATLNALGEGKKELNSVARNFYRKSVADSTVLAAAIEEKPSWETRESFSRAWGISPGQQLEYESLLQSSKPVLPEMGQTRRPQSRANNDCESDQ